LPISLDQKVTQKINHAPLEVSLEERGGGDRNRLDKAVDDLDELESELK
jgi:hypothetical protein